VYTAGYFGDTTGNDLIEMFDCALGKGTTREAGTIALGPSQPMNATRKGEHAFSDGTLCYETWQSCFSCHPFARSDGLDWTLGKDISSAPRNVKSMVYSWWTPPTGWAGKRVNAAESIRLGFRNSLFVKINYKLSSYIDTFLMHLQPVPSPYLVKGRLSPDAEKGKKAFFENRSSDCVVCHKGPLFTDKSFHVSGIPNNWDIYPKWDTPTLIETWRDAPYDHIGSFEKMEDLLRYKGHSMCLGQGLSEEDFLALVHYVLSL
jgi:cytochrome c peroxidase